MDTIAKQIKEFFMVSIDIDVSKAKSTVCFLKLHGEVLHKPFEVDYTQSSLSHLVNLISLIDEDVRVVMEATGIYHLPVLDYLKSNNIFISHFRVYFLDYCPLEYMSKK